MRKTKVRVIIALILFAVALIISLSLYNGKAQSRWIITQYPDMSGAQGMFYIVHDEISGQLIVIDGGWIENADQVRYAIEENGNHVDAWFVTHYHSDHIGAVNEILEFPGDIIVDRVYISPIDYDRYLTEAKEWDKTEFYTRFLEVTSNFKNVIGCQRNEIIEFNGLKVRVLNTYDDAFVKANTHDIANNAGLVLLFETENKKMLFMGDVHNKEAVELIQTTAGDDLKADYVQIGHHGNNTIYYEFFDELEMSEAFLDGPGWLMTSEQQGHDSVFD